MGKFYSFFNSHGENIATMRLHLCPKLVFVPMLTFLKYSFLTLFKHSHVYECFGVSQLLYLKLLEGMDGVYIPCIPSSQKSWYASYSAFKT